MTPRPVERPCSVSTRPHTAVDTGTGAAVTLEEVTVRTGWLLDLIEAAARGLVGWLWRPATFDVLAGGVDGVGRRLPVSGHVTAARLGWAPAYPEGVSVPSRVTRVVTAQVIALLRTLAYRDAAITDLQDPPVVARTARLSAADTQLAALDATEATGNTRTG